MIPGNVDYWRTFRDFETNAAVIADQPQDVVTFKGGDNIRLSFNEGDDVITWHADLPGIIDNVTSNISVINEQPADPSMLDYDPASATFTYYPPDLSDYATLSYVDSAVASGVANVDLTGYATEIWVQGYVGTAVNVPNLDDYVTRQEYNEDYIAINDKLDEIAANAVGYTGSAGQDGSSVKIVGSVPEYATLETLPRWTNYLGQKGDGVILEDTGNLAVATVITPYPTIWEDVGPIIGYTGSRGARGFVGSRGYTGSAIIVGQTVYEQANASNFWAITHNLGVQYLTVELIDSANNSIVGTYGYPTISFVDENNLNISWTQPATGYAVLSSGGGVVGFTGSRGFDGSKGAQGDKGDQGFTGSSGAFAALGFTGSTGAQGPIGYTGSQGDTGFTGSVSTVPGPIGFTGSKGNVGFNGSQGVQGNIGYTGSKGDIGFTGSRGDTGFTGSESTVAGPQGFTGSRGYNGSVGDQGGTGFTGSQGPQGNIGYTGSQGDSGLTANLQIVTSNGNNTTDDVIVGNLSINNSYSLPSAIGADREVMLVDNGNVVFGSHATVSESVDVTINVGSGQDFATLDEAFKYIMLNRESIGWVAGNRPRVPRWIVNVTDTQDLGGADLSLDSIQGSVQLQGSGAVNNGQLWIINTFFRPRSTLSFSGLSIWTRNQTNINVISGGTNDFSGIEWYIDKASFIDISQGDTFGLMEIANGSSMWIGGTCTIDDLGVYNGSHVFCNAGVTINSSAYVSAGSTGSFQNITLNGTLDCTDGGFIHTGIVSGGTLRCGGGTMYVEDAPTSTLTPSVSAEFGSIIVTSTTATAESLINIGNHIPTSDPGIAGCLWNDSGNLKIS